MRSTRRRAAAVPGRSGAIAARLVAMPVLRGAKVVMLFEPMDGEPDLGAFLERCRERGAEVVVPAVDPRAPVPIVPDRVDAVLVPGLAFTAAGARLGLGAGWYDRFLARVRPDCVTVGVCFDEQVLDALPVDDHDVPVAFVVTPTGTYRRVDSTGHGT